MICPKTLKGCCDDLCHGGGCLESDGEPMMSPCIGCGQPISDEFMDLCTCDPDEFEDDSPAALPGDRGE